MMMILRRLAPLPLALCVLAGCDSEPTAPTEPTWHLVSAEWGGGGDTLLDLSTQPGVITLNEVFTLPAGGCYEPEAEIRDVPPGRWRLRLVHHTPSGLRTVFDDSVSVP